jgi:hypothetical protein
MHVLEHVPDPLDFFSKIRNTLEVGGCVFLETPNLLSPKIGRISGNLFASPHLAIYSPTSLIQLLEKSGFELLRLEANQNLRLLARWTGVDASVNSAAAKNTQFLHSASVATRYRCWWLREQCLFGKRSLEAALSRTGRRWLSPQGYQTVRGYFHVLRRADAKSGRPST